jgi:hypothetical protein
MVTVHCPSMPGLPSAQARAAAPDVAWRRPARDRAARRLRAGVNNQMAQSAWAATTRERVERQSAKTTGPRVDAGVTELSEMTIGRTDDPENPILATAGQPGRVIVWGWIAEPIWASGHAAAPTGRTHDRNRTARQFSSSSLLHPWGRPHMREAQRRGIRRRRCLVARPAGDCFVAARLAMTVSARHARTVAVRLQ